MSDAQELVHELQKRISGEVRFDDYSRVLYSTDASLYQMMPVGVVAPRNADDVQATVETCHGHGVPVLPRGGGTSLSGQTVNHAVVMDLSKYMNSVVDVDPEGREARVQPGLVIDELNHYLRSHRLKFPPDPSTTSRATVGGAIGNNSCGSHSIVYGKTIDHVKELNVVLSDGATATLQPLSEQALGARLAQPGLEGRIYREVQRLGAQYSGEVERRFPKIMRRVSGYNLDAFTGAGPFDLTKIVVGSEGTLCAFTEAVVNLEPYPAHTAVAVLHFSDLIATMESTMAILPHAPSAVELMDNLIIDNARINRGFQGRMGFIQGHPKAILAVEASGESEAEVKSRLEAIARDTAGWSYACAFAITPEEQAAVWALRSAGQGLLFSVRGDYRPITFVEDTAVSPELLPGYIRRFNQIIADHDTTASFYGHVSVGCIHVRPLINLKLEEGLDRMESIANAVADLVLEFGGSLSGEHGDGIVRGVFTERMFGPTLHQAFRELKSAFDPANIMNPGKIIDCPPLTENLRISPKYRTPVLPSKFDFTSDVSFGHAIELCTGIGACRKTLTGAMCPSFMATREEEHSTRGRANALRATLTGELPPSEMTSRRMFDVLDLCLECKACKKECPIGVDMAKFKFEFLGKYYEQHDAPLRSRLFGNIAALSRLGASTAPLANWANRLPSLRWLLDRFLGIDRRRTLPAFARQTFPSWFKTRQTGRSAPRGQVVLFNDTFMDYNYPQVGRATVAVLEAAGFQVVLPDKRCCGRPMLSKGLLPQAQANARYNVDALHPYVEQGLKIVGAEPSCLLTLRDEYPELLGDAPSKAVAQASYMLEEFLLELDREGALDIAWQDSPRSLLFHGHCHQKAIVGAEPSLQVLRSVPGIEVTEAASGCCGMAGSFGFEKEHYDVSMSIGEQRLFPAVRQAAPGAEVVIAGVSCRQQIEHGTGVEAKHFAEVLAEALPNPSGPYV